MSLGYAEKLSYKSDVGAVGQKELIDSEDDVERKSAELASLVSHLEDNTSAQLSAGQLLSCASAAPAPVSISIISVLPCPALSGCLALHCRNVLHEWLHKWQLIVRGQVCDWHANEMRAGASYSPTLSADGERCKSRGDDGCWNINEYRDSRLQRAQRGVDVPEEGPAPAQARYHLCNCPTQPDAHGAQHSRPPAFAALTSACVRVRRALRQAGLRLCAKRW